MPLKFQNFANKNLVATLLIICHQIVYHRFNTIFYGKILKKKLMFFGRDEMPTFFHLMWPCGPQHRGPGQLPLNAACQRPPTNTPSRLANGLPPTPPADSPLGQMGRKMKKKKDEEEDSSAQNLLQILI